MQSILKHLANRTKSSLHDELSPFNLFCLLVTQGWLKPIKQNMSRPSSHSDRIRKCWKPGSVRMVSNSYTNTQKCNYTSGNSTWDIHMSSFKHGYVDAILYICMFHFQGVKFICRSASGCGNLKKPGSTKIRPKDEAISKAVS